MRRRKRGRAKGREGKRKGGRKDERAKGREGEREGGSHSLTVVKRGKLQTLSN